MRKLGLLSIIIPAYNEGKNIETIYGELLDPINATNSTKTEIIFVNDGSTDTTESSVRKLAKKDRRVHLISLSRNFGKETATTAGLHNSNGDAIIIIDADGQHPPKHIPEFVKKWENGANVVIGIRDSNEGEGFIKKYGSRLFYFLFNHLSGTKLIPGSTDFRLIDKEVLAAFRQLREQNRITRGLIDWLGFEREYIHFKAMPRVHGEAGYSFHKLTRLALNSFISLSFTPLYLFGYIGVVITFLSFLLGLFVIIEQYILSDPLSLNVSGAASLSIMVAFVVGLLLISQGIMSLYISKIYSEVKDRPLFVIDKEHSILP